ncbi:hypothetical protein [Marinomonas primoryensis]|uniref:hypothetical protein n=1 Tax=Marinomonas primoryensis TaxID=178399 RepID=UPI0030DDBD02|tara:strand:- start:161 stop:520 length:360 start_codon:yes stop_codon:yes gene_type:complete
MYLTSIQKAYPSQPCEFDLIDYIAEPFFMVLGLKNIDYSTLIDNKRITETSHLEETIVEITKFNHLNNLTKNTSYGLLWSKAQYDLGTFDEITKEQYQDYVELASALDWIDSDSDANDA